MVKNKRRELAANVIDASLPGPSRKRTPSAYRYRLMYQNPDPEEAGCALLWEVEGGRDTYQVALERREDGELCWHCSCADAIFRGENQRHICKHVRGLQCQGRTEPGVEQGRVAVGEPGV
jgi:hypothetical protein